MKIKVIAKQQARADEIAKSLIGTLADAELLAASAATSGVVAAVNGSRPNLVVLDDVDSSSIEALTQLSTQHPDIDAIVISSEQTPQFLMAAMQAGVREVLPHTYAQENLRAAVQRIARKRGAMTAGAIKQGKVFSFLSCKGGNGASFLAANLAHVLAHRGEQSAAMLDFDLQFGDGLLMLTDQRATSDVAEVAQQISRLDASLLKASMVAITPSLAVLAAPPDLTQALEVKAHHIETIIKQARQMFDYVVIDLNRSIDAVTLKSLDLSDMIFPVVQLTLPNVRDARRLRDLFRSLDYPTHKVRWVINRYQKSSEITLASFEQALGAKDTLTIPNHHVGVTASVNQGVPIDTLNKANPVAKALHQMAQLIAPIESSRKEGWLSSMFGGHAQ